MPSLNRRITVRRSVTAANDFGEVVTTVTDFNVWAELRQDRLARNVDVGGLYSLADRVWRVTFNQAFVDAHAAGNTLSVVYDAGSRPRHHHRRRRACDART